MRACACAGAGDSLPEALEFLAVAFLAEALLFLLLFADGVEEHDLVFLEGAKLVCELCFLLPFFLLGSLWWNGGTREPRRVTRGCSGSAKGDRAPRRTGESEREREGCLLC